MFEKTLKLRQNICYLLLSDPMLFPLLEIFSPLNYVIGCSAYSSYTIGLSAWYATSVRNERVICSRSNSSTYGGQKILTLYDVSSWNLRTFLSVLL